jgi:L,D-transpeptidase catalytic domain
MSVAKSLLVASCLLFGAIGVVAFVKHRGALPEASIAESVEISLNQERKSLPVPIEEPIAAVASLREDLPNADRMALFFNTGWPKLPIVETVTYSSRVDWHGGRPAWVADYAAHFKTSRHFIARSLNGDLDYLSQNVSNGDRFNVLSQNKNIEFYLVVDLTRCRMWVYYLDLDKSERVLLTSYPVGVGRAEKGKASGLLTPLGKYTLGSKVAVYRPGTMGLYNNEKTEMIRVFGTRWIPFEQEVKGCTAPARGFGIHGCPWIERSGELVEDLAGLCDHTSDGCIRLRTSDIEELFSVIISRPTTIELVRDFFESTPPGKEVEPICKME